MDFSTIVDALASGPYTYHTSDIRWDTFNPYSLNCGVHCTLDDSINGIYPPVFQMNMQQDSNSYEVEYVISTFDMMLGIVGGFYGSIYLIISFFLSDIEGFQK